eukprot:SAG22_NODE_10197_length_548_cov_0.875278_1_plen_136_part_10
MLSSTSCHAIVLAKTVPLLALPSAKAAKRKAARAGLAARLEAAERVLAGLEARNDGSWKRRYCEIAAVVGGTLTVGVYAAQGEGLQATGGKGGGGGGGGADWIAEVTVRSEADGDGTLETAAARTAPEWNGGRGEL